MSRKWTSSQSQAINCKGGSVIVSAAAGSGKTAVLVERFVTLITDPENPIDADKILVVTYTRAAAAELRERIYSKLSEMIKAEPFNKALLRQQALLSKTVISTIDSFCSSVVKEFFYVLNIDRNFRIADDSELSLIKNDAVKLTLGSMYADGEPDFFHLVEAFGGTKDDSALEKNIIKIHEFLRSHPYPDLWIEEKLSMFSDFDDVTESVWSKIVLDYAREASGFLSQLVQSSYKFLDCEEALVDKLEPLLESDSQFVDKLNIALANPGQFNLSDVLASFQNTRFPTIKGYTDNYFKLKIQKNRSIFTDTISKLQEIFRCDNHTLSLQIADLYVIAKQLLNCVAQFSDNYQKLKAVKKIADYPDLELWTIKLLYDPDTLKLTDIAKKLQLRFDEIMVDEYQDANEAQDRIFSALSKNGENLFFVGDVKQSIYGFRQAMPQLFLDRKDSSILYDANAPQFPAKIFLDKNFRSIEDVTQAVNFFFTKLMSESVGDIVYDDTETLKCGATYDKPNEPSVEYHLLSLDEIEKPDLCVEEANYIATQICKMVSEGYLVKEKDAYRPAQFKDFAVLMRNAKKDAPKYVEVFKKYGIPASCNSSYSFLDSPEIYTMTNFLSVIDNPALDIELLSVMMSPIFGFTPDDLTEIRCDNRDASLYRAVLIKAEKGDAKCLRFVDELKYYRDISVTVPVSILLDIIYERTGYESVVSALPEKDTAVNNLRLLKEYSKNFEAGGNKGLSRFVSYISRLRQNNSDIAGASGGTAVEGAVQVMSIHASKGLEYPICFVANTNRKFVSDVSQNVLINSKLGIAVKQKDELNNATFNTVPREAVALSIKRDEMSEELRVLYVAMTRAKQKLILVSSHKKLEKYLQNIGSNLIDNGPIMPFVVRNCTKLCEWLTMCAMLHKDGAELREIAGCDIEPDMSADFELAVKISCVLEVDGNEISEENHSDDRAVKETDNKVIDTLVARTGFDYKKSALSKLPSKIAASELSHKLSSKAFDRMLDTPAFMTESTLTAAQRGTALHAFMQFCDFSKAKADIEAEILKLCDKGFISKAQADSIDREKASRFINSELITRCLNSSEVYKEYRFTIKVDASLVQPQLSDDLKNEQIILQGSVDLAFVEDGELVIVDYKTDRVKEVSQLHAMYHHQLEIYRDAMEQCTDYKVKECLIYSVALNECICV